MVLIALAAALAYAVASVLQQRAAAAQPAHRSLRPALLLALARQPLWLAGIAASGLGLLLQLLALDHGSLTVVQPLLVCGLIFALPINALAVQRRPLTPREWGAALAVTAGLAGFLASAGPGGGRPDATPLAWWVVTGVVAAALAVSVAVARALPPSGRALVLACGAGAANALSAAFTKSLAHEAASLAAGGPAHLLAGILSGWVLYALGASLLTVIVFVQSAFQAGPIGWSLPALTAVNPLAAVLIGVTALHERVDLGALACAGEAAGLALAAWGVVALGSSPAFAAAAALREPRRAAAPASPPA